jgi:hypothetical protein
MTNAKSKSRRGPIEVWLRQKNLEITCEVVQEDESVTTLSVDSLSIRGAEREITGRFVSQGYAPAGRWQTTAEHEGEAVEVVRRFKVAAAPATN